MIELRHNIYLNGAIIVFLGCVVDCSAGWFGLSCFFPCNCSFAHSSGCDAKTGKCLCAEGWMGSNCRTGCTRCQNLLIRYLKCRFISL